MTTDRTALPERERNRLLRRVDWRFLLPDPGLGRVLCLAGEALRDGCALVAPSVDHAAPNAGDLYDVVVDDDPRDATITAAYRHLREGGLLYTEWSGVQHAEIARRLSAAGFGEVRCYAPWPRPPFTEVWVPFDVRSVFDYYERVDRTVYVGVRHRLGIRARRAFMRWRLKSGTRLRLCAIARKPHVAKRENVPADDAGSPPVISAARTEAHVSADARLTTALLTGGPRAISKVVGLVYDAVDRQPVFAVKWPRVAESEPGLIREANTLGAAHARGPAPGIPRLLARTGAGTRLAIAESAAHGTPLFTRLTRQNVESFTRLGASWLADFNARERAPSLERAALEAQVANEIARFAATFGPVVDGALLDDTTRLCAEIANVPEAIEHRDFGPWNIFVDDMRRLTVLDWESSRARGLPILDLIYFMSYMAFFVEGAMVSRQFAGVYRSSLNPRSPMGALRHELLEEHREALGISTAAMRGLRALCWIGHAESEFQQFTADVGGATPSPEALRGSVFVQLWREEILSLR